LQCAAAREQLWSAEANRLWEEIGRVWNRLYYEWLPATVWEVESSRWPRSRLDAIHFVRGVLCSTVNITSQLIASAPNCWAWLPAPGTDLQISPNDSVLVELAYSPLLRRLRSVRNGPFDDWPLVETEPTAAEALNVFLASPFLCALDSLELHHQLLTDANVATLVTAPNLLSVRHLTVTLTDPNEGGKLVQNRAEAEQRLRKRFPSVGIFA